MRVFFQVTGHLTFKNCMQCKLYRPCTTVCSTKVVLYSRYVGYDSIKHGVKDIAITIQIDAQLMTAHQFIS